MRKKKLFILFAVLLAVTLLVIFNSVVFSVQHVNVYCANREVSEYRDEVKRAHKIKRGSSIFTLNEKKIKKRIQSNVPHVRVLNIERKFPNRVYINYIEVLSYLKVARGGKTYYLGNDLRVTDITNGVYEGDALWLTFGGEVPENLAVNDTLPIVSPGGDAKKIISDIFDGFAALDKQNSVIDFLYEVDLSGASPTVIVANTSVDSKNSGMRWVFLSADNLQAKIRFAMSVYESDKLTPAQKRTGTLTVVNENKASYNGADVAP